MGGNIIKNSNFGASGNNDISPWQCTGAFGVTCGSIGPIQGITPPPSLHADTAGYISGASRFGQTTKAKVGKVYNLTYYAYSFDMTDSQKLVGWRVQLGRENAIDNQTRAYGNPSPNPWPFWSHVFTSTGNDVVGFENANNTNFYITGVNLECTSCGSSSNVGAIAGGVVGGVVFLLLLLLGGFWWFRRRSHQRVSGGSTEGFKLFGRRSKTPSSEKEGLPEAAAADYRDTVDAYTSTPGPPSETPLSTRSNSQSKSYFRPKSHELGTTTRKYDGLPEAQTEDPSRVIAPGDVGEDIRNPDSYPQFRATQN